jgi:hypothetical protein
MEWVCATRPWHFGPNPTPVRLEKYMHEILIILRIAEIMLAAQQQIPGMKRVSSRQLAQGLCAMRQ